MVKRTKERREMSKAKILYSLVHMGDTHNTGGGKGGRFILDGDIVFWVLMDK